MRPLEGKHGRIKLIKLRSGLLLEVVSKPQIRIPA